jgi:hypothetical protein
MLLERALICEGIAHPGYDISMVSLALLPAREGCQTTYAGTVAVGKDGLPGNLHAFRISYDSLDAMPIISLEHHTDWVTI